MVIKTIIAIIKQNNYIFNKKNNLILIEIINCNVYNYYIIYYNIDK